MIILDHPYISEFLQKTLKRLGIPVLKNEAIDDLHVEPSLNYVNDDEFIRLYNEKKNLYLYCNSENSIAWILTHLKGSDLVRVIKIFKDKVRMRELLKERYPDFFFKKARLSELESLDISSFPFPFIIKPAVGFFSMAVFKVECPEDWPPILRKIFEIIEKNKDVFPIEVIDSTFFIIEEFIEGEEYAVDAFFDSNSKPIIINIMKHVFSSEKDTSDRLYITSKEIINSTHDTLHQELSTIGTLTGAKRFPVHVEFRIDEKGKIGVIEVNPMRFAGFCVTDLVHYAFGLNSYELFFSQAAPEWKKVLEGKDEKIFGMIVGTLPEGIYVKDIDYIDHDAFCDQFTKVFACRLQDYHKYPVFSITFVEFDAATTKGKDEMDWALHSDFKEFVKLK